MTAPSRTAPDRRSWLFALALLPAGLALVVGALAAADEGDPAIVVLAPLAAAWVGGLPVAAGIALLRTRPPEVGEARACLLAMLVATVGWCGLLALGGSSTGALGLVFLPLVQGLAWACGSWFDERF